MSRTLRRRRSGTHNLARRLHTYLHSSACSCRAGMFFSLSDLFNFCSCEMVNLIRPSKIFYSPNKFIRSDGVATEFDWIFVLVSCVRTRFAFARTANCDCVCVHISISFFFPRRAFLLVSQLFSLSSHSSRNSFRSHSICVILFFHTRPRYV